MKYYQRIRLISNRRAVKSIFFNFALNFYNSISLYVFIYIRLIALQGKLGEKNILIQEKISKILKGIVICKESGEYLIDLIFDSDINPVLLSSFVGALSLFGKNLEKIEEINIKGLDLNMIIVYKHNLIFIALIAKNFTRQDIRNEAELSLDLFYSSYNDLLSANNYQCIDISQFNEFKKILYGQIIDYFNKIEELNKKNEIGNFGFFTDAIKRLREVQGKNA